MIPALTIIFQVLIMTDIIPPTPSSGKPSPSGTLHKKKLTKELVRALLNYNPDTGVFSRICYSAMLDDDGIKDRVDSRGNIFISVAGVYHSARKLAWLYVTGDLPVGRVYSISGDASDYRHINLTITRSDCTPRKNKLSQRNKSGVTGVSYQQSTEKWMACIRANGVNRFLGAFDDKQSAIDARQAAENDVGYAPSTVNKRNKSGTPGVSHRQSTNTWVAQITIAGKSHYVGSSRDKNIAVAMYQEAADRLKVGVSYQQSTGGWSAYLVDDGVNKFIGSFEDKQSAIDARKAANSYLTERRRMASKSAKSADRQMTGELPAQWYLDVESALEAERKLAESTMFI